MKKHTITVAALAPDSGDMLACGVYDALKAAPRLLLRTAIHGVADRLKSEGVAFETLDALYEQTEDFDELCELAVKKIIELARQEATLCYAVSEPQNDATVRLLAQKLPEDVELCVLSGMTLADAAACAVNANHAPGVNVNIGPDRSFESRTCTAPCRCAATSTQLAVSLPL